MRTVAEDDDDDADDGMTQSSPLLTPSTIGDDMTGEREQLPASLRNNENMGANTSTPPIHTAWFTSPTKTFNPYTGRYVPTQLPQAMKEMVDGLQDHDDWYMAPDDQQYQPLMQQEDSEGFIPVHLRGW